VRSFTLPRAANSNLSRGYGIPAALNPSVVSGSGGLFVVQPIYVAAGTLPISEPFFLNYGWSGTFADLGVSEWDGNYVLTDVMLGVAVTFPPDFSTSPPLRCEVPPLTNVTLTLQWVRAGVPSPIATGTIPAGGNTGTYSTNGVSYTVPFGDNLRLIALPDVDTTLIGISGVILGTRLNS
jgi:hypothetical protein